MYVGQILGELVQTIQDYSNNKFHIIDENALLDTQKGHYCICQHYNSVCYMSVARILLWGIFRVTAEDCVLNIS